MSLPHSMKSKARDQFDAWAATYDRSPLHRFLFIPAYQAMLEELYRWRGENAEPFDLLDIGCGTGSFNAMVAASSMPARIVGLDFCSPMCNVAAGKAAAAGISQRVQYAAGDSEHLPFADASFDAVTCSHSFHHYPHQQAVIREMRRVLRPGGRLLLVDGFRDNIIGWIVFDVIITAVEKEVFHAPWSTIRDYFENAGFRDIRHRKFSYWFPTLLTTGTA